MTFYTSTFMKFQQNEWDPKENFVATISVDTGATLKDIPVMLTFEEKSVKQVDDGINIADSAAILQRINLMRCGFQIIV